MLDNLGCKARCCSKWVAACDQPGRLRTMTRETAELRTVMSILASRRGKEKSMAYVDEEIASQPDCWRRAIALAAASADALPRPGERIAAVGCGTSWFMAMAYAGLREAAGQGEADAFAGSEFPIGRHYDRVVAITRSGTTTEILDL